jgi:hypothetical protein
MTLTVADTAEHASPMRGLLPLWVGVFVYALFLLAGNRLLIDRYVVADRRRPVDP